MSNCTDAMSNILNIPYATIENESDNASVAELKSKLRKELRRQRREQDIKLAYSASIEICDRVIGMPEYERADVILAYMCAKGEVDVSKIVDDAHSRGKRVAFPLCIADGGLRLLIPQTPESFTVGAYGIPEPAIDDSIEVEPSELDLIIVPAVAYTRECLRLGQGGGYYDRLLRKTSAFTVGVGYDFQLLDSLPVEKHDISLDCVALPRQLIRK